MKKIFSRVIVFILILLITQTYCLPVLAEEPGPRLESVNEVVNRSIYIGFCYLTLELKFSEPVTILNGDENNLNYWKLQYIDSDGVGFELGRPTKIICDGTSTIYLQYDLFDFSGFGGSFTFEFIKDDISGPRAVTVKDGSQVMIDMDSWSLPITIIPDEAQPFFFLDYNVFDENLYLTKRNGYNKVPSVHYYWSKEEAPVYSSEEPWEEAEVSETDGKVTINEFTGTGEGSYNLHVMATDGVMFDSGVFTRKLYDKKKPEVSFESGQAVNKDGSLPITITDAVAGLSANPQTIGLYRLGEGSPIGETVYEVPSADMSEYRFDIMLSDFCPDGNTDELIDGDYYFKVSVEDIFVNANVGGNKGTVDTPVFKIDSSSPAFPQNSKITDATHGPGYQLEFDEPVTIQYAFSMEDEAPADDDGAWTSYNDDELLSGENGVYPAEIYLPEANMEQGSYNLFVKAKDIAQNEAAYKMTDQTTLPARPVGHASLDRAFTNEGLADIALSMDIDTDIKPFVASGDQFYRTRLSTSPDWSDWKSMSATGQVQLDTANEGLQTVMVQYKFIYQAREYISDTVSDSITYDVTGPEGEAVFSTKISTYEPVEVTIENMSDNYSAADKITCTPASHTFLENTSSPYVFTLEDEAGNATEIPVSIDWIVNNAPKGKITYSTTAPTKNSVTAALSFDESLQDKITITNNGGINLYTFTDNGSFVFTYKYEYSPGLFKYGSAEAVVRNIDRAGPVLDVKMIPGIKAGEKINTDTTALITPDEDCTVTIKDGTGNVLDSVEYKKGGELVKYVVKTNCTIVVEAEDAVQNKTVMEPVVVDYIDKTPPSLSVVYHYESSTEEYTEEQLNALGMTKENVVAVIKADEPVYILNNSGSPNKVFKENSTFKFIVQDLAGNTVEQEAAVERIDKSKPVLSLSYSTEDWTSNDVQVTLTANRHITVINNGGSATLNFTENTTKILSVRDDLGNVINKYITVGNIDKAVPKPKNTLTPLFLNIGQDFANLLDKDIAFTDNVDGDVTPTGIVNTIDNTKSGTYLIHYPVHDNQGNSTVYDREVIVLGTDAVRVFVNGNKSETNTFVIEGNQAVLDIFGTEGDYHIYADHGRYTSAHFKGRENELAGSRLTADEPGWYTVYVADQERKAMIIYLYFNM